MKMKCGCEPKWSQLDFNGNEQPYCPKHDIYEIKTGGSDLDYSIDEMYEDYEKECEFIWGVKSHDDLSGEKASHRTMNDIDITYDKKEKKYYIGIETIFQFDKGIEGQKKYVKRLFDSMTDWMIKNNHNIHTEIDYSDIFTTGINFSDGFDSIEELHRKFKVLVDGFTQ